MLARQRLQRPVSPHLTIYKWQYVSLTSILQRISGMTLSGGLYIFAIAYLTGPVISPSWAFDAAGLVTAFSSWPLTAKLATKFAVAMPFTYHAFNGMKHLIWDTGRALKDKRMIRSVAWVVLGCSVTSACGLAMW
jgi:succinate dehydrogenase (ubiquinone) cytochrome b560 subunit